MPPKSVFERTENMHDVKMEVVEQSFFENEYQDQEEESEIPGGRETVFLNASFANDDENYGVNQRIECNNQ